MPGGEPSADLALVVARRLPHRRQRDLHLDVQANTPVAKPSRPLQVDPYLALDHVRLTG
jgi:hypothetical protein